MRFLKNPFIVGLFYFCSSFGGFLNISAHYTDEYVPSQVLLAPHTFLYELKHSVDLYHMDVKLRTRAAFFLEM